MFESATRSAAAAKTRWTTTVLSACAHIAIVATISALYSTDNLPAPRSVMAFVIDAPPAPPPPPPPAPIEPTAAPTPTKKATRVITQKPQVVKSAVVAAPVEAPAEITPEIGFEGLVTSSGVQAGFEGGIPGGVIGGVVGGFEAAPLPPPPVARATAPVRVGGEITAPRLIRRVEPEYPPIAEAAQIAGIVILEATVNREGSVEGIRVLRAHAFLQQAAIDAVEQWRYEPLLLNGQAQPFVLTVTLSFSIPTR